MQEYLRFSHRDLEFLPHLSNQQLLSPIRKQPEPFWPCFSSGNKETYHQVGVVLVELGILWPLNVFHHLEKQRLIENIIIMSSYHQITSEPTWWTIFASLPCFGGESRRTHIFIYNHEPPPPYPPHELSLPACHASRADVCGRTRKPHTAGRWSRSPGTIYTECLLI